MEKDETYEKVIYDPIFWDKIVNFQFNDDRSLLYTPDQVNLLCRLINDLSEEFDEQLFRVDGNGEINLHYGSILVFKADISYYPSGWIAFQRPWGSGIDDALAKMTDG